MHSDFSSDSPIWVLDNCGQAKVVDLHLDVVKDDKKDHIIKHQCRMHPNFILFENDITIPTNFWCLL